MFRLTLDSSYTTPRSFLSIPNFLIRALWARFLVPKKRGKSTFLSFDCVKAGAFSFNKKLSNSVRQVHVLIGSETFVPRLYIGASSTPQTKKTEKGTSEIPQAVYRELSEKKERDSGCYIQNPVKQINTGHYYLPIKTFFPQKANPYFRIRSSGIPFAVSAAAYSFSWI